MTGVSDPAEARFPGRQWRSGAPGPGVDVAGLDRAVGQMMEDQDSLGLTQALLVVHDGALVREVYGPGGAPDARFISWSIAKSITGALVGIAVGDGNVDLDQSNLFPEWGHDERSGITVRHLLNMSSGLSWSEDYVDAGVSHVIEMLFAGEAGRPTIDGFGRLDPRATQPIDTAGYAARRPLVAPPGTSYTYSSGTTNLLARFLAHTLGERPGSTDVPGSSTAMEGFMRERLFAPIGMTSADPRFDRAGTFVGSSYVYATAADFARFGWLVANDGCWDGVRVLPEGWVDFSGTEIARDPENGLGYGAHWWVFPEDPGSICALGYEGQYTYISRRRNLVIVRLGRTDAAKNDALRACIGDIVASFPVRV